MPRLLDRACACIDIRYIPTQIWGHAASRGALKDRLFGASLPVSTQGEYQRRWRSLAERGERRRIRTGREEGEGRKRTVSIVRPRGCMQSGCEEGLQKKSSEGLMLPTRCRPGSGETRRGPVMDLLFHTALRVPSVLAGRMRERKSAVPVLRSSERAGTGTYHVVHNSQGWLAEKPNV